MPKIFIISTKSAKNVFLSINNREFLYEQVKDIENKPCIVNLEIKLLIMN